MKKNAGFSLVELIAVIAIMAILSAGMVSVVFSQSDYHCRKAADEISAALSETRAQALAKSNAWMEIKYDSSKGYIISTSYSGDLVLGKHCDITFEVDNSGTAVSLDAATPLILSYSRGSGAFLWRIRSVTMTTADDGSPISTYTYAGSGNEYCTKITVTKGSRHSYVLTLYPETGKHKCEKI